MIRVDGKDLLLHEYVRHRVEQTHQAREEKRLRLITTSFDPNSASTYASTPRDDSEEWDNEQPPGVRGDDNEEWNIEQPPSVLAVDAPMNYSCGSYEAEPCVQSCSGTLEVDSVWQLYYEKDGRLTEQEQKQGRLDNVTENADRLDHNKHLSSENLKRYKEQKHMIRADLARIRNSLQYDELNDDHRQCVRLRKESLLKALQRLHEAALKCHVKGKEIDHGSQGPLSYEAQSNTTVDGETSTSLTNFEAYRDVPVHWTDAEKAETTKATMPKGPSQRAKKREKRDRASSYDAHGDQQCGKEDRNEDTKKDSRRANRDETKQDDACKFCGRTGHFSECCKFKEHPDANKSNVPFQFSTKGKLWATATKDKRGVLDPRILLNGSLWKDLPPKLQGGKPTSSTKNGKKDAAMKAGENRKG